jgi:imidazolonepropionase-like amidohydrolase
MKSQLWPEAAALVAALCFSGPALNAQGQGVYALRDARVVTVSGPVIERGTVVVRDGLILDAGESVAVPADAWVIDCKGLTIYPGLVDALSTWGLSGSAAGSAGRGRGAPGGPPARGPEDRPSNTSYIRAADDISPTASAIGTARSGGFTTAVVFPNQNIFSGQGSVIDLAGERPGDMVVADSVGQFIILRTSGFRSYPGSLMGVIAYIRQIYLDAEHYKVAQSIYEKHHQGLLRPAYDRTLEGVLASPRVLLPAERQVEVLRMLALAKELKLNAVLYGGHEAWKATDELKAANTPVLVSLKWPQRSPDGDPSSEDPLRILEFRDKAPSSPALLAKAGVKFAFYSDGIATPRELMRNAKKAIDGGLSPEDAIRAMTLTPAEIFGVADRLGSIDKGKIANLVVSDGDIFTERTRVKYVFVDGAKFEPLPETPPPGRGGRGATPSIEQAQTGRER